MTQRLPAEDHPTYPNLPEPSDWLNQYGDALYRYALSRLRRSHDAEEAVQDTLLAALKTRSQFEGRSHPCTWLMGILKRKIVDRQRAAAREETEIDPAELDAWFDAGGHWRKSPKHWGDPAIFAERAEFWRVVRDCLAKLPARMAEAFTLRTIDEEGADEVCRELAISPANLWVLLHRARLRLVRCLEINWFNVKHQS
ncbi:MAG TPA: sigma-70 family RNA polymerase sigma factor [Gemmataceae bacterium]|nr:sigma-70 family RNA polymerase sigma factor [Gemmataceae bacterium]